MTPRDLIRILGEELRRRPYLIAFLVALAGLAIWAIVPSPKRAIKEVIKSGERSIEARNPEGLRALLAADFQSHITGDRNREESIAFLKETFEDLLSIEIRIKRIHTQVTGDRATSDVDFHIFGTFRGEGMQIPFMGLSGQGSQVAPPLERCRFSFVQEADGYWRISGAELLGVAKG